MTRCLLSNQMVHLGPSPFNTTLSSNRISVISGHEIRMQRVPSKLAPIFPRAGLDLSPKSARIDRAHCPSSLTSLFRKTVEFASHCTHPIWVFRDHLLREHRIQIRQFSSYVSIISSRASNSCPQAVQRIQSDSTVNSSDLIPIPPQFEQRAR